MNTLIYWLGRAGIAFIQALPLMLVARAGRSLGALAWLLAARHRRLTLKNLTLAFPAEKSAAAIRAIGRECFLRLGENTLCAIKTAAMTFEELRPHLEIGTGNILPEKTAGGPLPNIIFAIGHFGNFELYARFQSLCPDYQLATTYRSLKQPAVNRLMEEVRNRGGSGCIFWERRFDGDKLRAAMNRGGIILGLLGDQYAQGVHAPFFGRDCHTGLGPAVLALRYECELYTAFCFRTGLAKWRLELGEKISTIENGRPRSSGDIMCEVNRSYEKAIRRDPANWFCWLHKRWKD